MQLDYEVYFDKVYGCWLGKCIAGTIGAPYEGMKQYIPLEYSPELFKEMLPNDDLDLQVLWLDALERKGVHVCSDDLAALFNEKNIYWPGEYAWFKKNYDRGICPPYTGIYENDFYFEGMGCPIRGEIWGMIYPCNPDAAAEICEIDGNLDHYGNSVYFERFWSSMVAAAFYESDIRTLLYIGLSHIPKDSKAYRLVTDVMEWCRTETSTRRIMGRILAKYGHKDCTNSFQNMGIIVFSLLKGEGDIIKTTMMAVRHGFDTDCTAGNAGALLGAVLGAKQLEKVGLKEAGYKLTLNYARKTDRVYDLAVDTCRVGLHFIEQGKNLLHITGAERVSTLHPDLSQAPLAVECHYQGEPYLQPGGEAKAKILIRNRTKAAISCRLQAEAPTGFSTKIEREILVPAQGTAAALISVTMKDDIWFICEKNIVTLTVSDGQNVVQKQIGFIGKTHYTLYGPFWDNIVNIEALQPGEPYYNRITGKDEEDYADNVRCYHLNTRVDPDKDYMTLQEIENGGDGSCFEKDGRPIFCTGDMVHFNEICPFDGQCAVYLKRTLLLEEERTVNINIGHTDAFAVWLNGELLCRRDNLESWTPENVHLLNKMLKKGENTIIIKLLKRSQNAKFSIIFLTPGTAPHHIVDWTTKRSKDKEYQI